MWARPPVTAFAFGDLRVRRQLRSHCSGASSHTGMNSETNFWSLIEQHQVYPKTSWDTVDTTNTLHFACAWLATVKSPAGYYYNI